MSYRHNQFNCEICKIVLPSDAVLVHFMGKKHQIALHENITAESKRLRSVFSVGWPNMMVAEKIIEFLERFGKLESHHIALDNKFVLATFEDAKVAQNLIKTRVFQLIGKNIIFEPRKKEEIQANQSGVFEAVIPALRNINLFDHELFVIKATIVPPPVAINGYMLLCRDLEENLQCKFPGCEAHPFGSTITGVAFKDSDVDVHMFVPYESRKPGPNDEPFYVSALNKASNTLRRTGLFGKLVPVKKAKTPIIKCVHLATGLRCDVNFKTLLGVYNSHLLKYYIGSSALVKDCVIILKLWSKLRLINIGRSRITNYAIIVLFIFYLQQEPFSFPSVKSLQTEKCRNEQDGWNAGFDNGIAINLEAFNKKSHKDLLLGFFRFYSTFDYDNVVCPYLGESFAKSKFQTDNFEEIPEEFQCYREGFSKDPQEFEKLFVDSALCVQDPFEHNRNITRAIDKNVFKEFLYEINRAVDVLNLNQQSILYRLLSDYTGNDGKRSFTIKMPKQEKILHLFKEIPKETKNPHLALEDVWFENTTHFLLEVLDKIFNFELKVDDVRSKRPRLDSQSKADTKLVIVSMTGHFNLWEARHFVQQDFKFSPGCTNNFQMQLEISKYIREQLMPIKPFSQIVNCTMRISSPQPKLLCVEISTNLSDRNEFFASFADYFVEHFPKWKREDTQQQSADYTQTNVGIKTETNGPKSEKTQTALVT